MPAYSLLLLLTFFLHSCAKDLKKNIDSGYPLIVLVDYGFWAFHSKRRKGDEKKKRGRF